ncbi:TniQ family protein [Streptomyces sp. NPDC046876]|uniref:TniQ family protein n=1 Tax=Streptomyces sp. NPDC046876 TaxID=3155616 RepID=UPI0033C38AF0
MPPRHHPAPRTSIWRLAPVQGETTVSYLQRLARRHHLDTAELLHGLGIHQPILHPECTKPYGPYTSIELYLNAPSRSLISAFAGIPDEHLAHALPEWNRYRDKPDPQSPRARLRLASAYAVTGCPRCTLARTGQPHPVPQYLPDTHLICRRHRTWMLGRHTLTGTRLPVEHADLTQTPEILAAHRTHIRFLRCWGAAADHALTLAMNLTETWRRAAPAEERIWPARARRIGNNKRARLWYALAREARRYTGQMVFSGSFTFGAGLRRLRRGLGRGGWGGRSLQSSAKAVRDGSPSLPSGSLKSGPLVLDPVRQRRAAALSNGRAHAGTGWVMQPCLNPRSCSVIVVPSGPRSRTCAVASWVVEAAVNAAVASCAARYGCAVARWRRHATSASVTAGITGGKKSRSCAISGAHRHGPVVSSKA